MLLPNGSAIHTDMIVAFNRAVQAPENVAKGVGTTEFWNFVDADFTMDLSKFYSYECINEAFEVLATAWEAK
mgnify:CR=1 FL=1